MDGAAVSKEAYAALVADRTKACPPNLDTSAGPTTATASPIVHRDLLGLMRIPSSEHTVLRSILNEHILNLSESICVHPLLNPHISS